MTHKRRLDKIERDAGSTCDAGCDRRPQGLFEVLTQLNTENA